MARSIVLSLLLVGCTAHQASRWVPTLALRGGARQFEGVGEERFEWSVGGSLAWRFAEAPRAMRVRASRRAMPASECVDSVLCVWEARERAAVLRRLEEP
jgi:hypothetical protein